MWELRKLSAEELMLLNCGVGEDSCQSLGLQGDPTSPSERKPVMNIHWKDWCWSWNSNTLATRCEVPTHWKRSWCWQRLKVEGEGDDRGWDGCMASPIWWTWVWVGSGSWGWAGKPGVLLSMWSQRAGHDWVTELNWNQSMIVRQALTKHSHFKGRNRKEESWLASRKFKTSLVKLHEILRYKDNTLWLHTLPSRPLEQ